MHISTLPRRSCDGSGVCDPFALLLHLGLEALRRVRGWSKSGVLGQRGADWQENEYSCSGYPLQKG